MGMGLDVWVKFLNYLYLILVCMEVNVVGVDEVILLNQFGYVVECSVENIFIVKGDILMMLLINDGVLVGIICEVLLLLVFNYGLECWE